MAHGDIEQRTLVENENLSNYGRSDNDGSVICGFSYAK